MNFIDYCIATKNYSTIDTINNYVKLFNNTSNWEKFKNSTNKFKFLGNKLKDITGISKLNRLHNSLIKNTVDDNLRRRMKSNGKIGTLISYLTNKKDRDEIRNTLKDVSMKKRMMLDVKNPQVVEAIHDNNGKYTGSKVKKQQRLWMIDEGSTEDKLHGLGSFDKLTDSDGYFNSGDKFYNEDLKRKYLKEAIKRSTDEGRRAEDAIIKTIRGMKRTSTGNDKDKALERSNFRKLFDSYNEGVRDAYENNFGYSFGEDDKGAEYTMNPKNREIYYNTVDKLDKIVKLHELHKKRLSGELKPTDISGAKKTVRNVYDQASQNMKKLESDTFNQIKSSLESKYHKEYPNATPEFINDLVNNDLSKVKKPEYLKQMQNYAQKLTTDIDRNKTWNQVKDDEGQLHDKNTLSNIRKLISKEFGGENVFGKNANISRASVINYLKSLPENELGGYKLDQILPYLYQKTDRRYSR